MISDASTTLPAIELTVELHADVPCVWRAITDPVELARWFPDRADVVYSPAPAARCREREKARPPSRSRRSIRSATSSGAGPRTPTWHPRRR